MGFVLCESLPFGGGMGDNALIFAKYSFFRGGMPTFAAKSIDKPDYIAYGFSEKFIYREDRNA
jgi:hypothetical protein